MGVLFEGETHHREFSAVVLCTGYRTSLESQGALSRDAVRARAFFVGLGPEQRDLLPLQGIGREAQKTAALVADMLGLKMRQSGQSSSSKPGYEGYEHGAGAGPDKDGKDKDL